LVSNHQYLCHTGVSVDENVWLTQEGVVNEIDDVADAAINWINSYTAIEENTSQKHDPDICMKAYPNPFISSTTIEYEVFQKTNVDLQISNLYGQKVRTFNSRMQQPGKYSFVWNGDNKFGKPVSTGVYYCTILAGSSYQTIKIIKTHDQ